MANSTYVIGVDEDAYIGTFRNGTVPGASSVLFSLQKGILKRHIPLIYGVYIFMYLFVLRN